MIRVDVEEGSQGSRGVDPHDLSKGARTWQSRTEVSTRSTVSLSFLEEGTHRSTQPANSRLFARGRA